jgi:hypothetical protein
MTPDLDDLPPAAEVEDGAGPDDLLAAALAAGAEVAEAAERAGVSRRTAFRRLNDVGFRARVDELRRRMVAQAVGRLADSMSEAADKLKGLLASDDERVQLAAAKAILEAGPRLREQEELAERVQQLEQVLREVQERAQPQRQT